MSPHLDNWKTIATISLGLGLFFIVGAAGQYAFTKSAIYAAAERDLVAKANDAVATILGVVSNGVIVPARLDKASLSAPNYIVISNEGFLEVAYSADKSNHIPGGIVSEVTLPAGDFSKAALYRTPAGDSWTVLVKPLADGYVILSVSESAGVLSSKDLLTKNSQYFRTVNGNIQADVNLVDNSVDYAVVDGSRTVTYAAGYVPLKTNLLSVEKKVHRLRETTTVLPLLQDIYSPSVGHVGVVVVWADLAKEQGVLDNELQFFGILAAISWLIALVVSLRYWGSAEAGKRKLRGVFERYLSPQVLATILKNPGQVELGGQRREITIMFSDIRSFTSLTETLPPHQLTSLLQEYFDAMTEEVIATQGVVDKFIGDAIMAFWGAPIEQEDQADRAVRTALRMIERLKALQSKWRDEGKPTFDIGIGIHLGVATVGNFGSHQRFDYTAIGDAVNTASRLESLNKEFASHIVISDATRRHLSIRVELKDRGELPVKGREQPVHVFEVLG